MILEDGRGHLKSLEPYLSKLLTPGPEDAVLRGYLAHGGEAGGDSPALPCLGRVLYLFCAFSTVAAVRRLFGGASMSYCLKNHAV